MCDITIVVLHISGWMQRDKSQTERYGCQAEVGWCKTLLVEGLFADDTLLFAENKEMLNKIVDAFDLVCKRRK